MSWLVDLPKWSDKISDSTQHLKLPILLYIVFSFSFYIKVSLYKKGLHFFTNYKYNRSFMWLDKIYHKYSQFFPMLRNILNIFLFNQTDGIPALHIEVASLHMHNALVDSIVDVSYTYITYYYCMCLCPSVCVFVCARTHWNIPYPRWEKLGQQSL